MSENKQQVKKPSTSVRLMNFFHRATTFTLFTITCAGLYFVSTSAYNIIERRRMQGKNARKDE